MNDFDWLRLGGLVARKWPEIDFTEIEIRRVDERYTYRLPVITGKSRCFEDDILSDKAEFEYETVEMERAVIEGHSVRVGYGPLSRALLIGMTRSL